MYATSILSVFTAALLATSASARFTITITEEQTSEHGCLASYSPSDSKVGVTADPEGPVYCYWDNGQVERDQLRVKVTGCDNNPGAVGTGRISIENYNTVRYERCGITTCMQGSFSNGVLSANDDQAHAC